MATNFFKIKKGLNLEPTSSPTLDQDGDIAYDSATNKIKARINGVTEDLALSSEVGSFATQELDNLGTTAINADLNPNASATRSLGSSNYWLNVLGQFFIIPTGVAGRFGSPNRTGSDNSSDVTLRSGTTVNGNSGDVYVGSGAVSGSGVRGVLNLLGRFFSMPSATSDPSTPAAGGTYYNGTDAKPKFYNGSVWRYFHMLWSDLNGFNAKTAVKTDDLLPLGDTSATELKKTTVQSLYNAVNELTTETTVDQASDFFPMYDASGNATDKVTVNSMLGGVRPAFMVTRSSNQSINSGGSPTKVQYDSESIDTNGNYDSTTNYRFTPTVAGYYLIGHYGRFDNGVDTTQIGVLLFYNGSQAAGHYSHMSTGKNCGGFIMRVMYFNGSTDYVEAYVYQDSGSARNWEPSAALSGFFGIRIA